MSPCIFSQKHTSFPDRPRLTLTFNKSIELLICSLFPERTTQGKEPICYHRPHMWKNAGGPQNNKLYLKILPVPREANTKRKLRSERNLPWLTNYLLITELRFDATLCSILGNETSESGHIECSRGLQVPHSCTSCGLRGGSWLGYSQGPPPLRGHPIPKPVKMCNV